MGGRMGARVLSLARLKIRQYIRTAAKVLDISTFLPPVII